jgi:hypothetical protein
VKILKIEIVELKFKKKRLDSMWGQHKEHMMGGMSMMSEKMMEGMSKEDMMMMAAMKMDEKIEMLELKLKYLKKSREMLKSKM